MERTSLAPTTTPSLTLSPVTTTALPLRAIDPETGWAISPIIVAMRALAMRFRGVLHSKDAKRLDKWIDDAQRSGIYAMQRFACRLRGDIQAVRNAVAEPWSNGQTEGQINRLKTLKRAMYGRASTELLRARMMPLSAVPEHEK
jgi:hypothetical protein